MKTKFILYKNFKRNDMKKQKIPNLKIILSQNE